MEGFSSLMCLSLASKLSLSVLLVLWICNGRCRQVRTNTYERKTSSRSSSVSVHLRFLFMSVEWGGGAGRQLTRGCDGKVPSLVREEIIHEFYQNHRPSRGCPLSHPSPILDPPSAHVDKLVGDHECYRITESFLILTRINRIWDK